VSTLSLYSLVVAWRLSVLYRHGNYIVSLEYDYSAFRKSKVQNLLVSTCCRSKIRLILILTEKGGGGVEPEIRGERQQFTEMGRKYQHD
jgi:hypothetical protein